MSVIVGIEGCTNFGHLSQQTMGEYPAIWDSLGQLGELGEAEGAYLLRDLGEALLARRFHYQLTRGNM
ncbi:hypothetical protein AK812_SmicGene13529 [Symbiodinium microadriaticum]|uniref:Uncharacterized protein n=1 Tax=Symbiodinium microadriaticum TaxID=2951 RepID=A0A1Q9E7Y2_SYMMI|nr:hypothetical protein AK812_SmicGene13529 [Symbiodinium microadriaticum]